jgi:hypothetical protein
MASGEHVRGCLEPDREKQTCKIEKFSAYEMFGEMRNSTPEENALYESMLVRFRVTLEAEDGE